MPELFVYTFEEDRFFLARQVMKFLGFSMSHFARDLKKVSMENKLSFADFKGVKEPTQSWMETLITEGGVMELISRAKKATSENLKIFEDNGFVLPIKPKTLEECVENKPRALTKYYCKDTFSGVELTYFIGYEVATLLDYKKPARTIKDHVDSDNQLLFKDFTGDKIPSIAPLTILINQKGAAQLLVKTRKLITRDVECIFKECGIESLNKKSLTKEQQFLSPIVELLKLYKPQDQYPVGKYRLDVYFPEYKIIVECDENGHGSYHPEFEREREDYINKELGVSTDNWVRFNPDESDYDVKRTIRIIIAKIDRIKHARLEEEKKREKKRMEAEYELKMLNMEEKREEEEEMYRCCTCREEKSVKCFFKNKNRPNGLEPRCKDCKKIHYQRCVEARKLTKIVIPDSKPCLQCKKIKGKDEFFKSSSRKDGLYNICKECSKERDREVSNMEKVVPETKVCSTCKEEKKSCEFGKRKKSFDGLNGVCKVCLNARDRLRKAKKSDHCQRCRRCKERKPHAEFAMKKNGMAKVCMSCSVKVQTVSKVCTGCKNEKPACEFNSNKVSFDGLRTQCKACESAKSSAQWRAKKGDMRICRYCKVEKSLDKFRVCDKGVSTKCIDCVS